jgi:hypothetical protein
VQAKRPGVLPNPGFLAHLLNLEATEHAAKHASQAAIALDNYVGTQGIWSPSINLAQYLTDWIAEVFGVPLPLSLVEKALGQCGGDVDTTITTLTEL